MKAAAFGYVRPDSLAAALAAQGDGLRLMAGGQSLGPMLNLRLARPETVADIRTLTELRRTTSDATGAMWGAATTHAEVEDGMVPDPTGGFLRGVAHTIAYRAVRVRGTVGGSLCHADPAADWPSTLALVGAVACVRGPDGPRQVPVAAFVRGPFETALQPGELLLAVRIPAPPAGTRHARHKVVRKTGEFAQAIAGVRNGPEGIRVVLGAVDAAVLAFDGADAIGAGHAAIDRLSALPPHRRAMLHASLDRAAAEVGA